VVIFSCAIDKLKKSYVKLIPDFVSKLLK